MFHCLTFTALLANSEDILIIFFLSLFFSRKLALTFHANYLHRLLMFHCLVFTSLLANSADSNLMIFFLSLFFSRKLSQKETICMKSQSLFSATIRGFIKMLSNYYYKKSEYWRLCQLMKWCLLQLKNNIMDPKTAYCLMSLWQVYCKTRNSSKAGF